MTDETDIEETMPLTTEAGAADNPEAEAQALTVAETASDQPQLEPEKSKTYKLSKKLAELINQFSACGRCSYFLTGYRVIHGVENMETAVSRGKSGWLKLTWNHAMRDLLSKSYGVQFNVDYLHFDGCCPECGRHYTYQMNEQSEAAVLRMEVRRRRR